MGWVGVSMEIDAPPDCSQRSHTIWPHRPVLAQNAAGAPSKAKCFPV